jgi:hypothetical protein
VTWGALAFVLTVLGGGYTWWAFRKRGVAAGTRGAALTLLPPAAWATGTLEMFTKIGSAIGSWSAHFVFSPVAWAGIVLAGMSAMLFGVSGFLRGRALGGAPAKAPKETNAAPPAGELAAPKQRPAPAIDDDLSEIEAILKKRGIS